jgi:thioredoxin-related protein
MKRFLITLTVVLSMFLSASTSYAAQQQKITLTIEKVTYSTEDKTFYIYTEDDGCDGYWVIDIKPKKGETLKQLRKRVIGHKIDIYIVGDPMTAEEIEIIRTVIH